MMVEYGIPSISRQESGSRRPWKTARAKQRSPKMVTLSASMSIRTTSSSVTCWFPKKASLTDMEISPSVKVFPISSRSHRPITSLFSAERWIRSNILILTCPSGRKTFQVLFSYYSATFQISISTP